MKTLFFSFLFAFSAQVFAQDSLSVKSFPKNTIFIGLIQEPMTLNYDRIVYEKNRWKLAVRGGIGITPYTAETLYDDKTPKDIVLAGNGNGLYYMIQTTKWNEPNIRVPLEISLLYGKTRHFAELSLGYTLATGMHKTYSFVQKLPLEEERMYFGRDKLYLGYRRQAPTGLFWKVGLAFHTQGFELHDRNNGAVSVYGFNTMAYINMMANNGWLLLCVGKSFGK